MTNQLKKSLFAAVANISKDRKRLCSVIKKIVDEIGSFRDAVKDIIAVCPKLSEKEIFTAYNIAQGNLMSETWQLNRYEVVKFLAENVDLDQQVDMFTNGVMVASPAHPEGHLVRLFDLKHCQIRYAWNFKKRRLFTDEERLEFAKTVFTGVPKGAKASVVDHVEGSISVTTRGNHKTMLISGSWMAIDIAKSAIKNKMKLRHFTSHKNPKDYYKDVIEVLKEDDDTFKVCPKDLDSSNFKTDTFGNAVLVLEHPMHFLASEIDLVLINLFALQLKKELGRQLQTIDKI